MNTATAFEQMANAIPYIDKLVNPLWKKRARAMLSDATF